METISRDLHLHYKGNRKMIKIDLKSAFNFVPIHPNVAKYFAFQIPGLPTIIPKVLTFGFTHSPYYFHKLMKCLIHFFRAAGLSCSNFHDDFIFWLTPGREGEEIELVRKTFTDLGFEFSSKSEWTPRSEMDYLGILLTDDGKCHIKSSRIATTIAELEIALQADHLDPGWIANLCGTLGFLSFVERDISLFLRPFWSMPSSRRSLPLDPKERDCLKQIKHMLENSKGKRIIDAVWTPQRILHTDASEWGMGAILEGEPGVTGFLPSELIGSSSTLRELEAIIFLFKPFPR